MTVNERIAKGEILSESDESIIDRSITVRMIPAEHCTDSIGTFSVRLVRGQAVFVEGVDDSSVNGFQAVTDIRERTGDNNGHRISQERIMHFVSNIHRDHFLL